MPINITLQQCNCNYKFISSDGWIHCRTPLYYTCTFKVGAFFLSQSLMSNNKANGRT